MEIQKSKIKNKDIVKVLFGNIIDEANNISGTIELDIENQAQFAEHINTILDDGTNHLILEMDNISYIDSSGLWALFESHKKAQQRSGEIVLLNPRKDVKRVLDITKISSKIKVFSTENDAIEFLSEK